MKTLTSQKNIFVQKIKRFIPSLSGKTIGILGLEFKSSADSPIDIINSLLDEGAIIKVFDPLAINRARKIFWIWKRLKDY
jgi:UDPglucose 6-dehydrogenase